jgi:hypothetical protein
MLPERRYIDIEVETRSRYVSRNNDIPLPLIIFAAMVSCYVDTWSTLKVFSKNLGQVRIYIY